jgi:hypothetical protein
MARLLKQRVAIEEAIAELGATMSVVRIMLTERTAATARAAR